MNFSKIREKFKNGNWVFGCGERKGCSPVFDIDSDSPQPFSFLGTDDADQFRIATAAEIREATETDSTREKPDGFYLLKSGHGDKRGSIVLLYDCPDFNGVRHIAFGSWDGAAVIPVNDLDSYSTLTALRIFTEGDGEMLQRELVQRCLFRSCQ